MAATDLVPVMERVAALADHADQRARSTRGSDQSFPGDCRAILEALTGVSPQPDWRPGVAPDAASVACLAKSVRLLASMLASTSGATIPVFGVLDGLNDDEPERSRPAACERRCLACGRPFHSQHFGHRMCNCCRLSPSPDASSRVPAADALLE